MSNEKKLFKACRLLFGEDVVISREFLNYLREEGISGAFRKKALELHPDRASLSGLTKTESQIAFGLLQDACSILRQHIGTRQGQQQTYRSKDKSDTSAAFQYENIFPGKQLPFGRFLYHTGIIDFQQIAQALAWQKLGRQRLGELAVKMGYLEQKSIPLILDYSRENNLFGMTAWELGLLTRTEVQSLLFKQRHQQEKIGQFFVKQGIINRLELKNLLSKWRHRNRKIQSITTGDGRMGNDERRKNIRVEFRTIADLTFTDISYADCDTENLSIHGVFVNDISNRNLGDICDITLKLTGSSEHISLSMKAEVVQLVERGIGLHFTEVDLDSFSHLRQIIHYNQQDNNMS